MRLIAIALFLFAIPARGDTDFVLTFSSAPYGWSWSLPDTVEVATLGPNLTGDLVYPIAPSTDGFTVNNILVSENGAAPVPYTISFGYPTTGGDGLFFEPMGAGGNPYFALGGDVTFLPSSPIVTFPGTLLQGSISPQFNLGTFQANASSFQSQPPPGPNYETLVISTPEPSSLLLLTSGLIGLGFMELRSLLGTDCLRRRKRL